MNWELSDDQAGFRKGRGTRDQIANIHWITENYDRPRQHIKKQKQRHYFADKVMVHLVKAMVFPVVMYACESWTIKKAES